MKPHLVSSKVGSNCSIVLMRDFEGSYVDDEAKLVTLLKQKTKIGKSSKANHFAYLGDAEIGDESNIGQEQSHHDGKK